jgi:hemerythrin-like domain-containing protein
MDKNSELPQQVSNGLNKVKNFLNTDPNILSTILEDHRPLKELIEVMKDLDLKFEDRQKAFADFAPLLVTHAKAEEQSLYKYLKQVAELKTDGYEGQTEHNIADQLCEEIKRTTEEDEMSARIKVLAELMEHHIEEEENDMFPTIRAKIPPQVLVTLNNQYVDYEAQLIAQGQDDAPHENELTPGPEAH